MSEDRKGQDISDRNAALRIRKLEDALLDYIERYGATDLARDAFRPQHPDTAEPDDVGRRDGDGGASEEARSERDPER